MTTPDIRLIAIDLDGTLLDSDKKLDPDFPAVLAELDRRGITVVPASGRQAESIRRAVAPGSDPTLLKHLGIIAENGALVARGEEVIATTPLARSVMEAVVARVDDLYANGTNVGLVMSGTRSAYVSRRDEEFLTATAGYYPWREVVPSLTELEDEPLKLAVWSPHGVEDEVFPAIKEAAPTPARVLVSGHVWVDVMDPNADKGHALKALQAQLDVTPAQTMAFGDYGNDIHMLQEAHWSYAMAEAHPTVTEVARYRAPSNDDQGVTRTIRSVLGLG